MAGKVSSDPNVFILPDLGEGLEEAELIAWKVAEGDTVEEHQIIAEMETDKALVEVPSPRAGTIKTLHGEAGEIMKVGKPLVTYTGGGSASGSGSGDNGQQATRAKEPPPTAKAEEAVEAADEREDAGTVVGNVGGQSFNAEPGKALATPAVRRLARDMGVDINTVAGSGIGGRVTRKDIEAAAKGGGSTPAKQSASTQSQAGPRESAPEPQRSAASGSQSHGFTPRPAQQGLGQQGFAQQGFAPQPQMQAQMQQQAYPQQMGMPYPMMMSPWGVPMMMVPMPLPGFGPGFGPGMMPGMGGMGAAAGVPHAPGYQPSQQRPIPDPAQKSALTPGQASASTPFRGVRRTIAERLRQSVDTAVHFTVMDEANVTQIDDLRRQFAQQTGEKLSFLPFVCVAVCRVLSSQLGGRFGAMNATVDDKAGEVVQHAPVHLGIATDTDSGLMVPVIRDADRLAPADMQRQIASVAKAARDRTASRDQLMGSTFTISNVGSHAGKFATPVINYPEVAILAAGRVYDGVVVQDGQAAVGKVMPLSLACDHRVVDGATAALALAEIVRLLEDPQRLM